ncbi:MAG: aspartate kinase [Saprospiraceae bacterium]|nr:aspartate kinase [Saprospiraceae bacterium]
MKVFKFGGTSIGTAERMKNLIPLIGKNDNAIVVLSAMSGTTDRLVKLSSLLYNEEKNEASSLLNQMQDQYLEVIADLYLEESIISQANDLINSHFEYLRSFTLDMFTLLEEKAVLAQGELISTALFQLLCKEKGLNSCLLPALNFMRIDENEEPDTSYIQRNISKELHAHKGYNIYITQGFICRNAFGEIYNLKRGGSDYTATLIGAAINAEEIQIWTDIDGIHNNDPRFVKNTFPIDELNFDEAAELAYFGAKILHPTCILPAKNMKIPVRLLNTLNPEAQGTIVSDQLKTNTTIKAIAGKDGIIAINIRSDRMLLAYGFLRVIFEVFERYRTPIDMITTSEVAVSLTIDNQQYLSEIISELQEFGSVAVEDNLSIVCIVGNISPENQGYAFRIFESIKDIPIRMISYGGSKNNISILVKTELKSETLNSLNKGLF